LVNTTVSPSFTHLTVCQVWAVDSATELIRSSEQMKAKRPGNEN
jgi:hypothetical protein